MNLGKLRISLFKLHAFFGLHLFGILALLFFSGSILVFVREIDAALNKDIGLDEPAASFDASVGQIIDSLKDFDPDLRPVFILPTNNLRFGDKTVVRNRQFRRSIVWSHPETAEILSVTNKATLQEIFFSFHERFMIPNRIGSIVTNALSLILLGFVLTGLWTYRQFWRGFFRLPPRHLGSRAWWGGLHRLVAVWLFPFLLLMGLTGSYFFVFTFGLLFASPPPDGQDTQRTPNSFIPREPRPIMR